MKYRRGQILSWLVILLSCGTVATQTNQRSDQSADRVYSVKEVTQRAKILSKPKPELTDAARQHYTEGKVELTAVLTSTGTVREITTVTTLTDGLTEQAIAAARKIKFQPALKDGKPVSVRVQLEYHFNILQDDTSVTRKPIITDNLQAPYTEEARAKKISGTVVLRVAFYKDGSIAVISVIKSLPYGLTDNLIAAVNQIKFRPAEIEGRPVSYVGRIYYKFSLK